MVPSEIFPVKLVFGVITKLASILTGSKYQLTGRKRNLVSLSHNDNEIVYYMFFQTFMSYKIVNCITKMVGLMRKPEVKQILEFTSEQFIHLMDFFKKRDTMIYNFKQMKDQTYEIIKQPRKILFTLTRFTKGRSTINLIALRLLSIIAPPFCLFEVFN